MILLLSFKPCEREQFGEIIEASMNASIMWLKEGPEAVMNKYNGVKILKAQ